MATEREQRVLGLDRDDGTGAAEFEPTAELSRNGRGQERRNTLNDLDVRAWMRATKSWFVCNPAARSSTKLHHPAKFPEEMVREFVVFFTKRGETVLDPFSGVGSAVVGAAGAERRGVGIELSPEFHRIATTGLALLPELEVYVNGDARDAVRLCREHGIYSVDYVITSPPYWNMLERSRGGVLSSQKERAARGLATTYSGAERDLGTITEYDEFLDALTDIFADLRHILKPNRYLTVVIQNVRVTTGEVRPLAWHLTDRLSRWFTFKGERLWLQDNKKLGCWGWPTEFVTNVHHHYCLVFKNDRRGEGSGPIAPVP